MNDEDYNIEDPELQDIHDDYTFTKNIVEGTISNQNTYYNNNSDGRLKQGNLQFVSWAPPSDTFDDNLQKQRAIEERKKLIALREIADRENAQNQAKGGEFKAMIIDDPEEWGPEMPQPLMKCFNCKLFFDTKSKQPMILSCEHTVCKECIIEKEIQGLTLECIYDNCIINGVYESTPNMAIQKILIAQDAEVLEGQVMKKVTESQIPIKNPSHLITRQDIDAEGNVANTYRDNQFNPNYQDYSKQALYMKAEQDGTLPKAPATIDDMFSNDILQDEEEEPFQHNAFEELEELERQKQTLRNKERKKFMLGPKTAKLDQKPITNIDGRQLAPINPSIIIGDQQRAYEDDHLSYPKKEQELMYQATLAEKSKMDESLGSTALIPVKLEAQIDQLKNFKLEEDEEFKRNQQLITEDEKLNRNYGLPLSKKNIVPGTKRDIKTKQFNDIDAKAQLFEQLNLQKTVNENDMGGIMDYQSGIFDKSKERWQDYETDTQYQQDKYHPETPFKIFNKLESDASIHRKKPKYDLPLDNELEESPEDPAFAQELEEIIQPLKNEGPLFQEHMIQESEPMEQPKEEDLNPDLSVDNYQLKESQTNVSTVSAKKRKKKKKKKKKGEQTILESSAFSLQKIEEIAEEQLSDKEEDAAENPFQTQKKVENPFETQKKPVLKDNEFQPISMNKQDPIIEITDQEQQEQQKLDNIEKDLFPSQKEIPKLHQLEKNEIELRKYVSIQDLNVMEPQPQPRNMQDDSVDRNIADYAVLMEQKKRYAEKHDLREQIDFKSIAKYRQCMLHPNEPIKYYCRDDKQGLCPECIVHHARHDFIFADEEASVIVKHQLEQLCSSVHNDHKTYRDLLFTIEEKIKELEQFKQVELQKMTDTFKAMRQALDEREAIFKRDYQEMIKSQFDYLNKDSYKLRNIYTEIDHIYQNILKVQTLQEQFDDYTIVGSCQKITIFEQQYDVLQRKLLIMNPPDNFRSIQNHGVQSMPNFEISSNAVKKFIEQIGSINNTYDFSQISMLQMKASNPKSDELYQREVPFAEKVQDIKTKMAIKKLGQNDPQIATITRCQQLQTLYQTTPHSEHIYWPKWDTEHVFRFDFFKKKWVRMEDIRYEPGFSYFSSICHLPKGLGMFILGGSDIDDNFSRRVTLFSKYKKFLQKPPMLLHRAFFSSIFCISDSCLYVFGGHDGKNDLDQCERYSVQENVWRQIAPMQYKRNGTSVVAFDRVIFVFGGNNTLMGSMDTIERYAIEFDKWSTPRVKLKEPIHDSISFSLGGARVLIFGGMNKEKPNNRFDIYDLTCEMLGPDELNVALGKIYLPPVFDPINGELHTFLGYGDNELAHQQIKIQSLMCHCRSVAFTDKASSMDNQNPKAKNHGRFLNDDMSVIDSWENTERSSKLPPILGVVTKKFGPGKLPSMNYGKDDERQRKKLMNANQIFDEEKPSLRKMKIQKSASVQIINKDVQSPTRSIQSPSPGMRQNPKARRSIKITQNSPGLPRTSSYNQRV